MNKPMQILRMTLRFLSVPLRLRRFHVPAILTLIVLVVVLSANSSFRHVGITPPAWLSGSLHGFPWGKKHPANPPPTLPELKILDLANSRDTDNSTIAQGEPAFCTQRFGPAYLQNLRDNAIEYCKAASGERSKSFRLTCFHSHTRSNGEPDSLCIAQGAIFDVEKEKFIFDCSIRPPTSEEIRRGLVPFNQIPAYWYETGPREIVDRYVDFQNKPSENLGDNANSAKGQRPLPINILIKREGSAHPWHTLMEIWSLANTIDVLRLSADPEAGGAFFTVPNDAKRTQTIILDNNEDGPFYDLWALFTGRKPVRLSAALEALKKGDLTVDTTLALSPSQLYEVVIPLAGAANPLWQNDWDDRDCKDAPLLKVFVRRVLHHLGLERFEPPTMPLSPSPNKKIKLTFIDRRGSRKLLGQEKLLEATRRAHPDVEIRSIDFASLSFVEQIRLVRSETDILVGAHGAGLTHIMFLQGEWEGGGKAVVEIQPEKMSYKGFRNLAYMLGHEYFVAKAETLSKEDLDRERIEAEAKAKQKADAVKEDAVPVPSSLAALKNTNYANEGAEEKKQMEKRMPKTLLDQELENNILYKPGTHLTKRDKWHFADLRIGENEFLELIGAAVQYVKSKQ
ncbi:hypothetical protein MCOR27_007520 [Pyricularia oryzae]|uniref:EGF domain-specific O-linked N-acetylglucosamine transferase n=1 Tax=Pyricularia grisea TaxID=148305 RepID=A0ABQ8NYR6_PYRGI|nr:hypothetical protein MCOR01_008608 [Pyricularia oryzae]KAI6303996.1 hypothetical protein MCOR33_000976 [Pyricularia grisea]KAI6274195.1 hypothetical protein MCOR27_007520 [Pyricularia oryzae]KAI6276816.1 hypothetical protein MCOR26_005441 [Pyricularia oryzae]KAI6347565.1 hypothetical protein MCOR28_002236 [Pyricularia oryzae]